MTCKIIDWSFSNLFFPLVRWLLGVAKIKNKTIKNIVHRHMMRRIIHFTTILTVYIYSTDNKKHVQWLKLPTWKVGDRGFETRSGPQVSKKQNVSYPLIRNDSVLWGSSVTERWRARPQTVGVRISNPVSGGQCRLIHRTILRMFFWPSLAYMCTNPKTDLDSWFHSP